MLRALDIPYVALNPGASYRGLHDSLVNLARQRAAADAAVPARGIRGRDRARLCEGDRADDGRRPAFERRPDARDDGDLQRVVRPRADAAARRDRPGRCHGAPALDRLDPYGGRPGRAHSRLHEMGRSAGARCGAALDALARAVQLSRDAAVRAGVRQSRRRHCRKRSWRRRRACRTSHASHPRRRFARIRAALADAVARLRRGEAPGDPDGPRVAFGGGLGCARRVGRSACSTRS